MVNPIPILLYHRVDDSGQPFSTGRDVFSRHLSWLADHGYRSLTTQDLSRMVSGSGPTKPGKSFMITFDDGFADLETTVAPVLRAHDFTATAFLITSRCPPSPTADSEYLAWSTARSLADEGVLEFQSHTHSHERWSFDADGTTAVIDDLDASLAVLSDELGRPRADFTHLAWPFGQTCGDWERAADRLGFTSQYVVQRGAVTRAGQHTRLPRLMVDGFSLQAIKAWMRFLSTSSGALVTNEVFGRVRQARRGSGYR